MSDKKHIEEMSQEIRNIWFPIMSGNTTIGEKRFSTEECLKIAEVLYNTGYRKQHKAEWVVCGDGEKVPFVCTHCCKTTSYYTKQIANYCPICGSIMKKD